MPPGIFVADYSQRFVVHFSSLVAVAVLAAAVGPTCRSERATRPKRLSMSGSHNNQGRMRRRSIEAVFNNKRGFFDCPGR